MTTILITGAGTGLGQSLAEHYAKMGHKIILAGRRESLLHAEKDRIYALGGKAEVFPCDITNYNELDEKIKNLQKEFEIDWLINNAGVGHFGEFEAITKNEMDDMIQTNVVGTIYMTKLMLPIIRNSNDGRIYNIISTAGLVGKVNEAVYCASKFGIRGFTEALQKEYKEKNVRFIGVYMGGMDTPFWDNSTHISDKSGLKTADEVTKKIIELDDGRNEIII
ncbi:SDR family NAD(P)-dependent oxidoreductase [Schinkia sp. CFF1]